MYNFHKIPTTIKITDWFGANLAEMLETGVLTNFYWLMPVGKFIEKCGLDDNGISMEAISEVTKRNTGEYAVRPYIRKESKKGFGLCKEAGSIR